MIKTINPATGEFLEEYEAHSTDQVDQAIKKASERQASWKSTSFADKAQLMRTAAGLLRERAEPYAALMASEMGKPIAQGKSESEKCAWVCEYYADNAEAFLADELIETDASESFVTYQPLGVILAIMPWNFPFWQVFRFAAPTLMAGNTALLKHASNVPGCALAIEDVFRDAGFPDGVFTALLVDSQGASRVIENPLVKAVSLTGSTAAGRAVAEKAASVLKKSVLELGGSDPYVILEDANLEEAVSTCVESRLINSGQSCIAAKRFIVPQSIRKAFEEKFTEAMTKKTLGDPFDDQTDIGPQARVDLRDELHQQVTKSVEKGATLLCGGFVPKGEGAYYPATVLTDVSPGSAAYDEELFGPVAAIIPVKDEGEAIRVANDSPFGLGAAVFTSDIDKGRAIAREQLEAGACFVNAFVRSDPRLPFGGIKDSGYGRELARNGILEFVNTKTVYVR
ncbi:MAG: NAD-dependent succinate-semialdehyde dehydrogenase [Rhodothermia bacterium]|nr:NAD-dependent succinate-semialdehyde dehydrogenase [Rhodothermia bacterium]